MTISNSYPCLQCCLLRFRNRSSGVVRTVVCMCHSNLNFGTVNCRLYRERPLWIDSEREKPGDLSENQGSKTLFFRYRMSGYRCRVEAPMRAPRRQQTSEMRKCFRKIISCSKNPRDDSSQNGRNMSNQQSLHSLTLRQTPISDSRLQAPTPKTWKFFTLGVDV